MLKKLSANQIIDSLKNDENKTLKKKNLKLKLFLDKKLIEYLLYK